MEYVYFRCTRGYFCMNGFNYVEGGFYKIDEKYGYRFDGSVLKLLNKAEVIIALGKGGIFYEVPIGIGGYY